MEFSKGESIFTNKAVVYKEARPTYPTEVATDMLNILSVKPTIIDVGAGTGKFTELLLKQNATVYAIEPNKDMFNQLKNLRNNYPDLKIINAVAEKIPLPNKIADLVVVAHALHWFNISECKKEFNRILKDNGEVGLIWNWYVDTPAMKSYRDLVYRKCATKTHYNVRKKINEDFLKSFFNKYETKTYTNNFPDYYNLEKIIKLAQSTHCTPVEGEIGFDEMRSKIETWFDKQQMRGYVNFSYICEVHKGIIRL